jgi:putative nucleotidyltransferase with HDIG domain
MRCYHRGVALPSLDEARSLLADHGVPDGVVVHSEGVRSVAVEAARLAAASGLEVDPRLVEVAALLHDIDKAMTGGGAGRHGEVGARRLEALGYPELAPPVRSHPLPCLLDETRFPRGWPSVLVSCADRHVAQEFLTIDERLDEMASRHVQHRATIERARRPAHRLEEEVATALGLRPSELVERLRAAWDAARPAG